MAGGVQVAIDVGCHTLIYRGPTFPCAEKKVGMSYSDLMLGFQVM